MVCPQMAPSLLHTMLPNAPIATLYYAPKSPYSCSMVSTPKCPYCYPIAWPQMAPLLLHGIPPNGPIIAPWHAPKWPHDCSILCPQMPPLLLHAMPPNAPIVAPQMPSLLLYTIP